MSIEQRRNGKTVGRGVLCDSWWETALCMLHNVSGWNLLSGEWSWPSEWCTCDQHWSLLSNQAWLKGSRLCYVDQIFFQFLPGGEKKHEIYANRISWLQIICMLASPGNDEAHLSSMKTICNWVGSNTSGVAVEKLREELWRNVSQRYLLAPECRAQSGSQTPPEWLDPTTLSCLQGLVFLFRDNLWQHTVRHQFLLTQWKEMGAFKGPYLS